MAIYELTPGIMGPTLVEQGFSAEPVIPETQQPQLPVTEAMLRAAVLYEAEEDLAEVVDLGLVRAAVREVYQLPTADELGRLSLAPTGTSNEIYPEQEQEEPLAGPVLVTEDFPGTREKAEVSSRVTARGATREDIETLVDVDMRAFKSVYKDYGDQEALRAELTEKFRGRYELLGPDWIRVAERDGEIIGFVTCCPTDKSPEDFESWEKTTDHGTLESTYNPNGPNIYVVSLSMLPFAGEVARNMLFTDQIGRMVEGGYERAFFESRLPGLRNWVAEKGIDPDFVDAAQKFDLATQYFSATREVHGKQVPLDKLIRIYTEVGCKFPRIVADAYDDEPSMNFGAVGVLENPLPRPLRRVPFVNKLVGKLLQGISHSQKLMEKAF